MIRKLMLLQQLKARLRAEYTQLCTYLTTAPLTASELLTTLALAVEREAAIRSFVPESFYTVTLNCDGVVLSGERMDSEEKAKQISEECGSIGKVLIVDATRKEKTEKPPALFDLTNLQREANRRLGYTAQQTLDYTQSLYEKKLVSYPRTDSRYLTEDMEETIPGILEKAQKIVGKEVAGEQNIKTVINGKKVSDHHAIIPTASVYKANFEELPAGELEILKLIASRLLEAVSEPCRYMETIIDVDCNGQTFKAKGKQIVSLGWKGIAPTKNSEKKSEEDSQEISERITAGEMLPMLNEFYNYIANNIIKYFQMRKDIIQPGERFCLRFDNEEILAGVNESLRNITSEHHIQGVYEYESVYSTFTIKVSPEKEIVVAAKLDMDEGFLAKLRNVTRTDKNFPILMLTTQSVLDTITSGTADLSAKGMPFHASSLMAEIDDSIGKAQLSIFDQAIMKTELERKRNDRYSDKSSLYEYRELLTVLERGYVLGADYAEFGLLEDPDGKIIADYVKARCSNGRDSTA